MGERRTIRETLGSPRVRQMRQRWAETLLLAGLTGVATGLAVAGFETVTVDLLDRVRSFPSWVTALAPAAGLLVAWMSLRWIGAGASSATADEYIRNFHDPGSHLSARPAPAKLVASSATIGTGGALGFEGATLYAGAVIGTWLQRRFRRIFSVEDLKLLMVVGAAAGVAAIFKTPATGALFALEVPYRRDQARRATLPALIGAVTSYVAFVLVKDADPLIPVRGQPTFGPNDLVAAVALGIACGVSARAFAWIVEAAKDLHARLPRWATWSVGGASLAFVAWTSLELFGDPVALGPGYRAILTVEDPDIGIWLVVALFALRLAATTATIAGGGVGGVFIPLVAQGAILGRLVALVAGVRQLTLLPLIGAAAFLGAGYRVPIAAVVFVAEATGRPGFIVPGMIATVIAQLFMGSTSVTPYQVTQRGGHVEERLQLKVTDALRDRWTSVDPEAEADQSLLAVFVDARTTSVPVVDDTGSYVGMLRLADVAALRSGPHAPARVADLAVASVPASPGWTLADAVTAMDADDLDTLAVVHGDAIVGLITLDEILRLDQILERREA